jgi:tetratricopeptide (TPR) repeat protein
MTPCTNCKRTNHKTENCYADGGAKQGQALWQKKKEKDKASAAAASTKKQDNDEEYLAFTCLGDQYETRHSEPRCSHATRSGLSLEAFDPDLRKLVEKLMAITDVSASYPVAYTNAGSDRVERGEVDAALAFYDKALARNPKEETALEARTRAKTLKGDRSGEIEAASRALAAYPTSGSIVTTAASARWYGGLGPDSSLALLERSRPRVRRSRCPPSSRARSPRASGRRAATGPRRSRSPSARSSPM